MAHLNRTVVLDLSGRGYGALCWRELVRVLPLAIALEELTLSDNFLGDEEPLPPVLRLPLTGAVGGGDGHGGPLQDPQDHRAGHHLWHRAEHPLAVLPGGPGQHPQPVWRWPRPCAQGRWGIDVT